MSPRVKLYTRPRCLAITHGGRQCQNMAYKFSSKGLCTTHINAEKRQFHAKVK